MHVGQKFERLLEVYRRPDGSERTGVELERATGGIVHRSYVTNLRKGRIDSPGLEKMRAIAEAMGFPPAAWFEETPEDRNGASLDGELVDALRDKAVREAAREISRLSERERQLVLGIVRQFGEAGPREYGD